MDAATDPGHYKHGAVECWEFAGAMGFLLGSATKYLYRAGYKDDAAQDIGKAKKFIEREIHVRATRDGTYTQPTSAAQDAFLAWYEGEQGSLRGEIVRVLWSQNQGELPTAPAGWSLLDALVACDELIEEFRE